MFTSSDFLLILFLALTLDFFVGELPRAIHPVVWIGKLVSFLEKIAPSQGKIFQLIYGGIMTLLTILAFALPIYFLLSFLHNLNPIVYILLAALLLKTTFAFRELRQTALNIKSFLIQANLKETRANATALVSRETQKQR